MDSATEYREPFNPAASLRTDRVLRGRVRQRERERGEGMHQRRERERERKKSISKNDCHRVPLTAKSSLRGLFQMPPFFSLSFSSSPPPPLLFLRPPLPLFLTKCFDVRQSEINVQAILKLPNRSKLRSIHELENGDRMDFLSIFLRAFLF